MPNQVSNRIPGRKLIPKINSLRTRGWTYKQIAEHLGRSERYVYKLVSQSKPILSGRLIPDPIPYEELSPEAKQTVQFTPEGFKLFFERYSGRKLHDLHYEWVKRALSHPRVLINCPPRHAKSTIFSVWFPIWLICINRNIQIVICSQTNYMAKKFTNEISTHLTSNELLLQEFGRFKPEGDAPWRPLSGELMVEGRTRMSKSGDLTVQVRGARQQILGMEADWVIADDIVDRPTTVSPAERVKLSTWFHGDVMTRLEPKSTAIVIGQRLHLKDLYGELSKEKVRGLDKARWEHINYPAITDWDTQQVLWPEKWPYEELMDKFTDVGSSVFEAMYQQNPLPESERLVREAWLIGDDEHPGCLDLLRSAGEPPKVHGPRVRVASLDPGQTRYWGLIVGDLDWNPDVFEFHLLEARREKWQVRDAISALRYVYDTYAPDYFLIERNAARHFLQNPGIEDLRRKMRFISHDTGRNKADPTLGVESIAVDFEFGHIRLPSGDSEGKLMSKMVMEEAMQYPHADTDDLLMALWFIKFNYRRLVPRKRLDKKIDTKRVYFENPPRLQKGWEPIGGY